MRKRCLLMLLSCAMLLTGCGATVGYSDTPYLEKSVISTDYGSGIRSNMAYDSSMDYTVEESYVEPAEYDSVESGGSMGVEVDEGSSGFDKDMLIYYGDIRITTKEFESDLTRLKSTVSAFDSFYENEQRWADKIYDDRAINYYSATIRVASDQYEDLLNGLNSIGTVSSLGSSCENVSAEYSDTIVAIDIYEAERDRYINLLSSITDDQYAIEVQRELTDIELKLAQFRARKQNIETDVSYSYVTVNLEEVREYNQQTEYNDNFFKRLWNTLVNTFYGFMQFLEYLLFTAVRIAPYILLGMLALFLFKKVSPEGSLLRRVINRLRRRLNKTKKSEPVEVDSEFKIFNMKEGENKDEQNDVSSSK